MVDDLLGVRKKRAFDNAKSLREELKLKNQVVTDPKNRFEDTTFEKWLEWYHDEFRRREMLHNPLPFSMLEEMKRFIAEWEKKLTYRLDEVEYGFASIIEDLLAKIVSLEQRSGDTESSFVVDKSEDEMEDDEGEEEPEKKAPLPLER